MVDVRDKSVEKDGKQMPGPLHEDGCDENIFLNANFLTFLYDPNLS